VSARRFFRVPEMDCAHEAAALRKALEPLDGVLGLQCDPARRRVAVLYDPARRREADLVKAIEGTGMRALPWDEAKKSPPSDRLETAAALVSGAALLAGFLAALVGRPAVPFHALSVAASYWRFLPRAFAAARRARPDMHLLMSIAILGAILIGEWAEAASVGFLFSVSLLLESWSVGRARRAVEALLRLAPATATLLDPEERRVAAEEVPPGSRILVRGGERIPLDGVVLSGSSDVDCAAITGEGVPVARGPGDAVFAGTINGPGALEVRTTRAAGETTVAHIASLVEEAGARRSRSERWTERFAAVYTPIVLALALLVATLPPLLGAPWGAWLYRALALLVIACPCALVISTPVAIVAGLTAAARRGVLVKSGEHLETPARLRAIAFDKTGTLTYGRPRVVAVLPLEGHDEADLLARAAAVEARSEHPIGRAIVAAALARGLRPPEARDVVDARGRGCEGTFEGREFRVGRTDFVAPGAAAPPAIDALRGPGRSVVVVGNDRHLCGAIALEDEMRPEAPEQVRALRAAGIGAVWLLTGDNAATAAWVGAAAGVDEVRAELLPESKVAAVEEMAARHGASAMVGDGVNDAPAMARSSLGIAMAAAGSDAAIETADVALMTDDLSRIPWLIGHSRRTLGIIRQNVAASLVVKAAFVALTLFGPASLWAAIAADMGISLAVVFNALRLLR